MSGGRLYGQAIGRVDGARRSAATARYSADVTLPGLIWGKALRSPLPHARILGIEREGAGRCPACWPSSPRGTCRTCSSGGGCSTCRSSPGTACASSARRSRVAAALDPDVAEEAARLDRRGVRGSAARSSTRARGRRARPSCTRTPVRTRARRPSGPHPNVQSVLRFGLGDVEAGFREADRIFEHTFRTQLAHQGYLEPMPAWWRSTATAGCRCGLEQDALPAEGAARRTRSSSRRSGSGST